MSATPAAPPVDRREAPWATVLFAGLLLFHFWAATVGWTSLSLPGEEFRQAQTAQTAQFIQRERNFSLAYPTPVLGKPWSVPMEFPLYQWTTVALSDVTGMPLTQAGRTVSLACFYLTLPALYLLLAHLGLRAAHRLVALGLVVTSPLYIFYARAFLIETMALMFAAWFLLGLVRAVERRQVRWLMLALAAGTGAGLVKVTTLMLFLLIGAVWTLPACIRQLRAGSRWEALKVAAWAGAGVAVPCLAALWWVRHADAIKRLNPLGRHLTSGAVHDFTWGVGRRFDPGVWQDHLAIIFPGIVSAPLLLGVLGLWAVFSRRLGWEILLAGLLFLSVQVAFPVLYAVHAYYYVANAFLLLLGVGLALTGLLGSRLPRPVAWSVVLLAVASQGALYFRLHHPVQRQWSAGGTTLSLALREITEPESVLVIAGDDWSSVIPFHAQRRAAMLLAGREHDRELWRRSFAGLQGEQVSALLLKGAQRENREVLDEAVAAFGLDPRPVFTREDITVYLRAENREFAIQRLVELRLPGLELSVESAADQGGLLQREILVSSLPPLMREAFARMTPRPVRVYSAFGIGTVETPAGVMYNAHPVTKLWFDLPHGARRVSIECLMVGEAYADHLAINEKTDGIGISLGWLRPDGSHQPGLTRQIEPATRAVDRGLVRVELEAEIPPGSTLLIEVTPGPHGNYTRDWVSLGRIEIK